MDDTTLGARAIKRPHPMRSLDDEVEALISRAQQLTPKFWETIGYSASTQGDWKRSRQLPIRAYYAILGFVMENGGLDKPKNEIHLDLDEAAQLLPHLPQGHALRRLIIRKLWEGENK